MPGKIRASMSELPSASNPHRDENVEHTAHAGTSLVTEVISRAVSGLYAVDSFG
jgi:hypothetical protein